MLVPAGEFMMGNSYTPAEEYALFKTYGVDWPRPENALRHEYPQHLVKISRPFWMGAHHVTRGQFRQFVEDTGYVTDAEKGEEPGAMGVDFRRGTFFGFHANHSWRKVGFPQAHDHPVVTVTWNDAMAFCRWLSEKEGQTYRLPTEAEWEYACRAGTTTRYWCGDNPEALAKAANIADAELKATLPWAAWTIRASDGFAFTSPVGSFPPNPFGLHDMHGNAWQWCGDRWRFYDKAPVVDPVGTTEGRYVLRGGSWSCDLTSCRSATRIAGSPGMRTDSYSFRVVREKREKSSTGEPE